MKQKIYPLIIFILLSVLNLYAAPFCNVHANITEGNNVTVCAGSSVTLDATPTGSQYTYIWTGGETTASITFTPGSSTTYSVTVTDTANGGCNDNASTSITVNPVPAAAITANNNNPICAHQSVTLTASGGGGGGSYHWSTGSHNTSINVNPSTTTTYTVTVTKNGCTATANATVTVNTAALAGLFTNCNAVTVSPYTISLTDVSNPSTGNTNYTIIWGDTGANYSGSTLPSPLTHTYGAGSFNLTYIVTTAAGCVDTGYFTVRNLTNPSLAIGSPGNTLGCGPLPLCFPILNVVNNDASTTYVVSYGDGTAIQTYSQLYVFRPKWT